MENFKEYIKPEAEITMFETVDVIATSGETIIEPDEPLSFF